MKIRFRSEKAETVWITAVQIYFAGLILLILFPLFCLLMPTGSVGEFEIKLGLMIGYAAVGLALPVYLAAGVIIRCVVSMVLSKNLTDETALPPDRKKTEPYRKKVRRIRGITAMVCVAGLLILSFIPYQTVRFEEGMVQTRAVAYTIVEWNREDAGREIYFFPLNHMNIGKLWEIRH